MFRAITEINVLVQLRWDPLITQCTFHDSRVVSQHSPKYVNCGFESWSTQLFLFHFSLFSCQRNAHKHKKSFFENVMTDNFLMMLGVRILCVKRSTPVLLAPKQNKSVIAGRSISLKSSKEVHI